MRKNITVEFTNERIIPGGGLCNMILLILLFDVVRFNDSNSFPFEYKEILEDLKALDAEQLHHIKAIVKGLKR